MHLASRSALASVLDSLLLRFVQHGLLQTSDRITRCQGAGRSALEGPRAQEVRRRFEEIQRHLLSERLREHDL